MGKASSTKKVSRAASTGGGRTVRGAKPWLWYLAMGAVVLLGVAGIAFSRDQRRDDLALGSGKIAPIANKDHWHSAYGVYLCDQFAPPIQDEKDPKGIHSHGDGVIHVHPFVRSAAGNNATLGAYAETVGMTLTDSKIKLPGGKSFTEGDTKCGGKPGVVQVKVDDKVVTDGVVGVKLTDRALITIAFAPENAELPPPPSASTLDNLSDVPPPSTTVPADDHPETVPGETVPGDTVPGEVPPATVPEG